jgi:hypothetical protein
MSKTPRVEAGKKTSLRVLRGDGKGTELVSDETVMYSYESSPTLKRQAGRTSVTRRNISYRLQTKSRPEGDILSRSPLQVNRRFGGTNHLHLQSPKNGGFSETSLDFRRTTRRYIPKDGTPHNLKSYII